MKIEKCKKCEKVKKISARQLCVACYRNDLYHNPRSPARETALAAQKRWQLRNREKLTEYIRQWRALNPDKVKANNERDKLRKRKKRKAEKLARLRYKPMPNAEAIVEMQNIMFNMGKKWREDDESKPRP